MKIIVFPSRFPSFDDDDHHHQIMPFPFKNYLELEFLMETSNILNIYTSYRTYDIGQLSWNNAIKIWIIYWN